MNCRYLELNNTIMRSGVKKSSNSLLYRWAFACGREKEFIPPSEIRKIPRSTRSTWRKMSDQQVRAMEDILEAEGYFSKSISKHEEFWKFREELFNRAIEINQRLIHFVGQARYHELLESHLEEFVDFIESQRDIFQLRDLLKWFSISDYKYRNWKSKVDYACQSSMGQLCARKHPLQLDSSEYNLIERAINSERFIRWPRTAIHSFLLRRNQLRISRSTFYKYAARFQPIRSKRIKKPAYNPIRATRPDAYWHVDISVFFTMDDQRSLIYALIDNYSRKILSWRCDTGTASKKIVGEMIKEALAARNPQNLVLVTDGGPENINGYIKKLIYEYSAMGKNIRHEVAMTTIRKSNSMIERFFRLMKYDYLFRAKPDNPEELQVILERMFHEYNFVRPHYSLDHRTPDEAYRGVPPMNFRKQLLEGRRLRFEKNKNCACQVCIC